MPASNEKLLFNLPVTRHWLEQFTLLSFKHGTSYRDILESLSVLFNLECSMGWVYEVIHHNSQKIGAMKPPDLSDISCAANDELFDHQVPLLTSVCTYSLYCPLLQKEQHTHKIRPIRIAIQNNKKQLLGFVRLLEEEFEALALAHNGDVYWIWQICYLQRYDETSLKKHELSAKINSVLRHKFYSICQSVICIMSGIDKASSLVENFNGRVRKFIINHRNVGQELLDLLRFTMNHTPFF